MWEDKMKAPLWSPVFKSVYFLWFIHLWNMFRNVPNRAKCLSKWIYLFTNCLIYLSIFWCFPCIQCWVGFYFLMYSEYPFLKTDEENSFTIIYMLDTLSKLYLKSIFALKFLLALFCVFHLFACLISVLYVP